VANGSADEQGQEVLKMKDFVKKMLPQDTVRRKVVAKAARKLRLLPSGSPDSHYSEWIERTEPFSWSPPKQLAYSPLISIVVPVYNSPGKYLMPMVYSVINQRYEKWELILVNASSERKCQELTRNCLAIDNRIKVVEVSENKGIAGNTDLGIKNATGEYIGLLDHDDTLAPAALYEVALALQAEKKPQLIYSDEDKISEDGKFRFDPFFKPDWSPFLFRHVNYMNHFSVIEKQLLTKAGGYRKNFEGAQDYDLFLRLVDNKPAIHHIPKILYHWRTTVGSTAQNFDSKKNVRDAAVNALGDHLARNKQAGRVSHVAKQPGFYTIDYIASDASSLAVLVLPSIAAQQYAQFAPRLIDTIRHAKIKTDIFLTADAEPKSGVDKSIHYIDQKDKDRFIEQSLSESTADILMILGCAALPLREDWADRLAGLVSQIDEVAVATPLLVDRAGKVIVDAGFVDQGPLSIPLFQWLPPKSNTYLGNTTWGRDIDRSSNRINVMRREIFDKYFKDSYPMPDAGREIYKNITKDGCQVVLDTATAAEYFGDLALAKQKSAHYNPNLVDLRRGVSLPKTINIPPETER
jgi:glycosyltransferase involved in cell wall biosynthesis